MNSCINLLENLRLLQFLLLDEICSYLQAGQFKVSSYDKDSIIHIDGEKCNRIEIVISGTVGLLRIDESGDTLMMSECSHNDILGGNTIFAKNPYYIMNIIALSKTQLLEINKETLFYLLCNNSNFLLTYLESISNHAMLLEEKIKKHYNKKLRDRILMFLIDECKKQGTNCIKLPMTKKSLAERIGVQRTSLSRELANMKKDGLISYNTDYITLFDQSMLE